jgi:hypothetical protein
VNAHGGYKPDPVVVGAAGLLTWMTMLKLLRECLMIYKLLVLRIADWHQKG